MTNKVSAGVVNVASINNNAQTYQLVISNGLSGSSGLIEAFASGNQGGSLQFNYGTIGAGGAIVISNSTMISYSAFQINSGGTLILNSGSLQNDGSINDYQIGGSLVVGGSQGGGPLVVNNTSTLQNNGNAVTTGGHGGVHLFGSGNITVNSGTFLMELGSATSYDGLTIDSGASISVGSGASFIVSRYVSGGWNQGAPINNGIIYLNGGTFETADDPNSKNPSETIFNGGTIVGSGTLLASVYGQNGSGTAGSIVASNGTLNIFGSDNGHQAQAFDYSSSWGSYIAVSNGDLKVLNAPSNKNGGAWTINGGGTLEIAANVALDLGGAFMPPSSLAGVAQVDSGANLTLSSATSGAAYSNSTGSSFIFINGQINTGYASNNPAVFGNYGTLLAVTGNSTFETGNNGGSSSGLGNFGTILATNNGSTFYIDSGNAYGNAFSNAVGGSIVVSNGATVAIQRSTAAWDLAGSGAGFNANVDTNVVNMGNILLNNGTFTMLDATSGQVTLTNYFRNAGTISVVGGQTGYVIGAMSQMGTLALTNNLSVLSYGGTNAMTNSGTILLGANGAVATMIASNIGAHGNSLFNSGTIQGQGTLTLGLTNGSGGANANFVNSGLLLATNWGGSSGGSLFISVGDAFSNGGFSNTAAGTILISSNMTLTINRTEHAWAGGGGSVANFGTISMQGGSLNLAADGAVSNAASFINTGTISGWGTINSVVITTNGGAMIANATPLGTGVGTLTASIASTTNNSTATLGVVGTNSVLNILTPGSQNVLLNYGTIQLSGGSIDFNGGTGTITNFYVVAGVGNLSSFGIVNTGALASIVAQLPISGLSNLIANIGTINMALLGATATNSSSAATLTLGTTSGGGLINNGTIALQGGFITVTNTAGVDAGITNQSGGLMYGLGTQNVSVANLSGGTLLASNGILRLGMRGPNSGVMSNLNNLSTIILTNTVLQNTGTIALNGGGLIMGGSTITNDGTIIGPGNYSSGLYNGTDGTVVAQNGTLAIATNGATESVNNLGTFSIGSASTLSVGTAWNNTTVTGQGTGQVILAGGTLAGGAVTNQGRITGNGTITAVLNNVVGGTLTVSGGSLQLAQQPVQNGNIAIVTGGTLSMGMSSGTFTNGGTIVSSGGLMVFSNSFTGTFLNQGVIAGFGTNSLDTTFSAHDNLNPNFVNAGTIIASNGLFMINAADSFTQGGFSNAANGTIAVSNGATFAVNKTGNYWSNGGPLANQGTIVLNGGTITLYSNGVENAGVSNGVVILNNGTIIAQGTATNTWGSGLANAGTIYITNNASVFNVLTMNALTNSSTGQIFLGANGAVGSLVATNAGQNGNSLTNAGTIEGQGTITLGVNNDPRGSGASAHLLNSGTLIATNWGNATPGTLFISTGNASSGGGFENLANGTVQVATNMTLTINRTYNAWANSGNAVTNLGVIAMGGGTLNFAADGVQSNAAGFINNGVITGSGIIVAGVTNAAQGTIAPSSGTLTINGSGGFGNSGTFVLNTGNTLLLTNFGAATGLTFSNAGTIQMSGGQLLAGVITNAGTISGFGTIDGGGVANGGTILASNLTANAATLTVRLSSYTNASTASIGLGVLGTNTVLNIHTPGNVPFLINLGTVNLSGGQITNSLASSFAITNFDFITGVGNLSSLSVVNTGATASIIAQLPVQGVNTLQASIGLGGIATNSATLGANNLFGAATLSLSVGNGVSDSLYNQGTINLNGGFITINNGAGRVTNLSGGIIFGSASTESNLSVANLSGGTIMASNGILRVGIIGPNSGLLSNFNSTSTIVLTNTVLVNSNNIALNGGGLIMGGSTITNEGTISGPGNYSSGLYNDTTGTVVATGGTLNIATNGATESVNNLGTITVASGSTLNVMTDWNNTNGLVSLTGGTLTGGAVTNKGTFLGNGTITSGVGFVNASAGTAKATNGVLAINSTSFTQNGTLIGGTANGTYLQITNASGSVVNNGTIILDGSGNLGLYVLQNFTNAAAGVIQGAGILRSADNVIGGGGANFSQVNFGTIVATNGTLIVDSGDAFNVGFANASGATVTVANASTFGVARSTNAFVNARTNAVNNGVIQLFGGTVQTYTNTGTGTAAAPVADSTRVISNAVGGLINGNGSLNFNLANLGTVNATNGTLVMAGTAQFSNNGTLAVQNGATLTSLQNTGTFANNNQMILAGGTFVGTNFASLNNTGTISGFGTVQAGELTGGNGAANAPIINVAGALIDATNGTLFLNPGNSFNNGGFSNAATATARVESNATLALNRTAFAWNNSGEINPRNLGTISLQGGSVVLDADGVADASRFIDNVSGTISGFGTISGSLSNFAAGTIRATNGTLALQGTGQFLQAGTLEVDGGATMLVSNVNGLVSISNAGTILMNGGALLAGAITNANWIYGNGSITGNVSSGVINLGSSFLFASNGLLSASLGSFTNGIGSTMGTLTTNATLNVQMPGGAGQLLINQGTLSFAGGTLLANGTSSGIITNLSTGLIVGVGNVTQTVANNGTILAANPVSGLNVFSVGLSDPNLATIGASNGAILNVVLSGGANSSFNNNGSVSMLGGTLIISNGAPGVISNLAAAFVTGVGTVMPNIVNLGTVQATIAGGILDVSLSTTNAGFLRAGSGATLTIENGSFVNTGTIGAVGSAGGTIQLAAISGVITNSGLITGFGGLAVNGFVQNVSGGRITATNGVLAFNAINGLANTGTIDVENGGTFQSDSSNSWSNAGSIDLRGGTLRTGGFTNALVSANFTNTLSGVIDGYGTLIGGGAYGQTGAGFDKSIVNLGTIIATNPLGGTAQTLYVSTGGATAGGGIQNLGNMIVSSNDTLVLDRGGLPVLNTGTITINNGTLSSTSTITNTLNGIIQGYGTLTASIVNQSGGTIRATNGILTMTSTVFPINQGTFEIDNGATMTWNTSNSWINSGTVDILGGTLRTGGSTNPAVTAIFTNLNTIIGYGTIYGGGAFNTNGVGIDKSIVNLGTVIASNGVLTLNTGVATSQRGLANLGTMIIATTNDTLVLARTAEIDGATPFVTNLNYVYNSGTILINGGTLTSDTSITNNNDSATQAGLIGLIQGFGTIALTNQLVNLGTIRSTNTVVGGNGILQFVNPAGSALQINQSGTLAVEAGSQMIFGSDSNAPVANAGTITMDGGILRSGMLTNNLGATFEGFGTIASSIINSGTGLATSVSASLHLTGANIFNQNTGVLGANNGRLIVDTVFTNAGTVSFINSVGTFASAVVNQGAWVSDPSTNTFLSTYTVATNGYISMAAGDVYLFQSNFVNVSSLSNQYNTLNGKFVMNGQGTQQYFVAGINLGGFASSVQSSNEIYFSNGSGTFSTNGFSFAKGDSAYGYSNNFALGTLELSDLSTTVLMDSFGTVGSNDNKVAGLYLNDLTLDPGSLLIISNNVELYFQSTNGVTGIGLGTLGAGDNVLILDGGSFHQLTVVPEPSILMLLSIGAFAIVGYRRRKAKLPPES